MRTTSVVIVICAFYFAQGQRSRLAAVQQPNATPALSSKSSSICPEPNGRFPTGQCDSYIECKDGVGEETLCPDGLLFNAALGPRAFPCQYPIDVDCVGRSATQEPQPTADCPHQYGYYKLGDEENCGQFKNCAGGRAYIFDCPQGLAFNEESYRCDWPDQVNSCNAEGLELYSTEECPHPNGYYRAGDGENCGLFKKCVRGHAFTFECAEGLAFSEVTRTCEWPDQVSSCNVEVFLGFSCPNRGENRFYKSPANCQKYFVCLNGKPRLYNCGEDEAFNELTNACDAIENVDGCALESEAKSDQKKTNSNSI